MEHGDLLQPQVGELAHDEFGLVVVRGAQVERKPVERLAQTHGASERREERHLGLEGQRQRGHAGGRADVTKQGEHIGRDQLVGVLGAAIRFVAIVELQDFDALVVHATLAIELVKEQLGACVELNAELRRGPGEGSRLPQHDAVA
jgi:hypothetical protein